MLYPESFYCEAGLRNYDGEMPAGSQACNDQNSVCGFSMCDQGVVLTKNSLQNG